MWIPNWTKRHMCLEEVVLVVLPPPTPPPKGVSTLRYLIVMSNYNLYNPLINFDKSYAQWSLHHIKYDSCI